ncbi:peptide chain release factor H [Wukongibacter baidiensis]|uniref:peptide chain release factor H n=1 Tax=Wukongibacter baidiensis TaxID=1723361 RepID=UPI003D7F505F
MWVQISAGLAPIESCRFVYLFLNYMKKECMERNIKVELLECVEGDKKETLKSAFLRLSGESVNEYVSGLEGSMQWICKSQYRPNHKRKNWFIEIETFGKEEKYKFNIKDVRIETLRCSGNGGQNVNKLETGVRITHLPTGVAVKAQEERSQYQNKKLAMARLRKALDKLNNDKSRKVERNRWEQHQSIQRGYPIRVFKGRDFREIL